MKTYIRQLIFSLYMPFPLNVHLNITDTVMDTITQGTKAQLSMNIQGFSSLPPYPRKRETIMFRILLDQPSSGGVWLMQQHGIQRSNYVGPAQ